MKEPAPRVIVCRFNGAAARMRRREGWNDTENGRFLFASTGPPHGCGGGLHPGTMFRPSRGMLQRGRRTDAAEGLSLASTNRVVSTASTGPPHGCGGGLDALSRHLLHSSCFNGAAARMRRRESPSGLLFIPDTALQRGRRTDAAEGGKPKRRMGTPPPASTGPPHGCGGGSCETSSTNRARSASTGPPHGCGGGRRGGATVRHGTSGLQRGRRTDAAEGACPMSTSIGARGFNGAAARMRRRVVCMVKT